MIPNNPLMNQTRLEVGDYWYFIIDTVLKTKNTYNVLRGQDVILSVSYNEAIGNVSCKFFHNGDYTLTGFTVDRRKSYQNLVWEIGKALENFVTSLGVNLLNILIQDEGNRVDIPPFTVDYNPSLL